MANLWYCTRESVASALDVQPSVRTYARIDDAIESASRSVEGDLNRVFYPTLKTIYKDWPNNQHADPWVLWLDQDEVISVTALVSGGVVIPASAYNLEPVNAGPPFDRIETKLSTSSAFNTGTTYQQSIAITGLFGYNDTRRAATTLSSAVASTSATSIVVADGSRIGVGSLLIVDSERMSVTDRAMSTTGLTLSSGGTTASAGDVALTFSGPGVNPGETILIDAERMYVLDAVGGLVSVKRAVDGTVLATHAPGATVYASRTFTVERAVLGTVAATHSSAAAVYAQRYPGTVEALTRGEAINTYLQESAGYARTVGSGDNVRNASGAGLEDVRRRARAAHGRKARMRSV